MESKKGIKEIVVLSGKGGTGKTSITGSFAALGGNTLVLADCDVDAADMHLITAPKTDFEEAFYSGKKAIIRTEDCIRCNKCLKACHFDAIHVEKGIFSVDNIECEGCAYCFNICPTRAIDMLPVKAGKFFISQTRFNNTMVHARLGIAADNSGKLVTKVRDKARSLAEHNQVSLILTDASPGIGCPVVASLTGADMVVLVTEPTVSGFHDLKRVIELIKKLKIKTTGIINKADINLEKKEEIKSYLIKENIPIIAELPYNVAFTEAMVQGKTIVEWNETTIKEIIKESWNTLINIINK